MGNPLAYRPLTQHFYFYFNQLLFDLDPTGHHLSNLLVHLVNGLLVFWLARRWISPGSAWIAAALFWFHPAHFYEVFWVSGISQSGFVFCLLSVLYCWSRKDEDRWGRYWRLGAWVAAAAAFLSKEDAVMLPAIVTVFSWLFGLARPFFRKQTCFELVPFWVLLSAYLGLRFWVLGFGLPEGVGTYEFGLSLNLLASKILTYLQWMSPKLDAVAILLPLILIWICCLTSPEQRRSLARQLGGLTALAFLSFVPTLFVPSAAPHYLSVATAALGWAAASLWEPLRRTDLTRWSFLVLLGLFLCWSVFQRDRAFSNSNMDAPIPGKAELCRQWVSALREAGPPPAGCDLVFDEIPLLSWERGWFCFMPYIAWGDFASETISGRWREKESPSGHWHGWTWRPGPTIPASQIYPHAYTVYETAGREDSDCTYAWRHGPEGLVLSILKKTAGEPEDGK